MFLIDKIALNDLGIFFIKNIPIFLIYQMSSLTSSQLNYLHNMKKILLTTVAAFCSIAAFAQAPVERCGTMEHHEYLKQTKKGYEQNYIQYNQMIEQYMQSNQFAAMRTTANITIPVVIHVVYNTAAQNISDAQAISQFSVLNNDFQRLNADTVNTPAAFKSVAGGVGITFCLAQRDPNGNATTGIVHKSTSTTSFSTDDKVKKSSTGGDDPWDVTKYVNIWVCNLSGGILGYGEFPTGSISQTYGLVLNYTATGTMGTVTSPYNKGRTGTHEFGHCFNLNHIWGDNGQCGASDNCTDTPPQKGGTANPPGANYGAPTYPWQANTCTRPDGVGGANVTNTNGDMFMNYMDYTNDAVMNMFTKQQCARMLAVVTTAPWNVLASSNGCTPVSSATLDAGIASVLAPAAGSSQCNNAVTPKITLTNVGSATLTSAKVLYKMDALATQTLNWSGSMATGASTVLTLNAYSGLTTAAHTFSVWVTAPNAGTDQNAANNSMSSTFTVVAPPTGTALPFVERFDATTFPPTGWVKLAANTLNAANTWTRVANTTGIPVVPTTTACAKMDNYSGSSIDITGQLDALRTPALSFTGANSSLNVTFDVSYRLLSTTEADSLNVYISTDCGGTWSRLYSKGGSQLATVTGTQSTAFTPTANAQWRRETVSLSSYAGQASAYLKFESRSNWGNNVYLDNVNVSFTTTAASPVAAFSTTATKCPGTSITFSDASTNSPTSWAWSFPGGTPSSSTQQNPVVTYTAAGTYTITQTAANATGTSTPVSQTITVNANPVVSVSNVSVCPGTAANLSASGATTYSWNTGATTSSISATPTITTNYTVTGINTAGCSNTKTVSVTVKATPTVAVASKTICTGAAASLTASGASSYSWNTGATTSSVSVTPTITTTYTVTGTNTLSCTDTKTVSVTVNALPNVSVANTTICAGSTGTLAASGASTYSWNTGATGANLSVNPSGNTTYTVTGISSAGCAKTATASVTVGSAPSIAVNSATICAGSTTTLTASGVTTYTWNNNSHASSISVNPTTTTTYTVSGNLTGCTSQAVKTVTVTVNQLPTVTFATVASPLCSGNAPVTLTGTPAGGTFSGTGVTGSSFSPATAGAGTFTLTYNYTNANSCSASATRTVSVSLCTGITEVTNTAFSIYPNPAKDVLYITMDGSLTKAELELYDALGKLVIAEKITDNQMSLDITGLAKGIYTVRIVAGNEQVTRRMIKE